MATHIPDRDTISVPPDGRPRSEQPAWRQDFPIDWPQDQYVERRDFVKFLVLVSSAFATGQVWIVGKDVLRRRAAPPAPMPVARVDDVKVGSALSFNYPGEHDPCLLVRADERTFLAYNQKCTHLACAVLPRVEERSLHCPCHEGSFDLMTGRPTGAPRAARCPRSRSRSATAPFTPRAWS